MQKQIAFNLQLLAPKVGNQAKNIFARPLLKLLSFMFKSSMRGQTIFFLFGLQFSMLKVGARAKTFASTPLGTPENGALGAPKHGIWEHKERPKQTKLHSSFLEFLSMKFKSSKRSQLKIFLLTLLVEQKKLHLAFNFWCQKLEAKHNFLLRLPMFCKTREILASASNVWC